MLENEKKETLEEEKKLTEITDEMLEAVAGGREMYKDEIRERDAWRRIVSMVSVEKDREYWSNRIDNYEQYVESLPEGSNPVWCEDYVLHKKYD